MKKIIFYTFTCCLLLSVLSLNAQQYQLPDSDFETGWEEKSGINGKYEEYQTKYFYTLNSLFAVQNDQGPGDITAWKDSNFQHGNYCIKLVSGKIPVGEDIFLPGLVGTINEDFVQQFIESGGNVDIVQYWDFDTPHALEGWFKYNPEKGDSALIDIGLYDGEKLICLEKLIIKETVNEWTHFSIKIPSEYWNENLPNHWFSHIRVLFVASAGVNFDQLQQCKGQLGSTLWIDNIYLNYGDVGIKQNLMSSLKTKAYPNPVATDVLNIELNENFTGKIAVFDMTGRILFENRINAIEYQLNISNLSSGNYIYKLMDGNTIFAQGKFVVTK